MRKIFALGLLLAGCREAPEPFKPIDFEPADPARLTYNVNDDRVPAWTTSNDSVLYVAESYPPYDSTPGIVLSVPRASGVARPILDAVQVNVRLQPWLTAPAVSADGKSVAFFEMTNVAQPEHCDSVAPFATLPLSAVAETHTILQQAVLRVRTADNINAADNTQLTVNFTGRTLDTSRHPFGLQYVVVNVAYPYQRMYERDGTPVFRASW